MRTAIVLGGTGLTGSALLTRLVDDPRFGQVIALGRRRTGLTHAKLRDDVVDFEKPQEWADRVRGDVAFSALGTTRAEAGSLAAQRRVDVDYQRAFAQAAAANGVESLVLLSSIGADAKSFFAYPRMKGELDEAVAGLSLPRVRILRPAGLVGNRAKPRPGEKVGACVARFVFGLGFARQYRPIPADTVARAMVEAVFDGAPRRRIYTGAEIFELAEPTANLDVPV